MTEALAPRFVARGLANGTALEDYGTHCRTARERLKGGDAAGGAAAARRATELAPRGLEAQRLLGVALLELGEARPALTAFQAALAGEPLDVVAQAGVAQAQERLGGVASAEPEWLCAWELQPGLLPVERRLQAAREAGGAIPGEGGPPPLTSAALARIYLRGGLYEHAVAEARAALSRHPDRRDLNLTLAEAFWRSGDGATSAAVAQDLLERLPDCVAANLLLATHWQTVGRDPSPLLARVRAADPEGRVAVRLFGDRDAPPPLEGEEGAPAPQTSSTASAMVPAEPQPFASSPLEPLETTLASRESVIAPDVNAAAPDLAADLPEAAAESEAEPTTRPAVMDAATDGGDEPVDVEERAVTTPEATQRAAVPAPGSPEEAPPANRAADDHQPEPEAPPAAAPAPELTPALATAATTASGIALAPPTTSVQPAMAPGQETRTVSEPVAEPRPTGWERPLNVLELQRAGDSAMHVGNYVEAIRHYGAALRHLRTVRDAGAETGGAERR